jgi:predicted CxxxxCH...CXXCH cytochrome family protein
MLLSTLHSQHANVEYTDSSIHYRHANGQYAAQSGSATPAWTAHPFSTRCILNPPYSERAPLSMMLDASPSPLGAALPLSMHRLQGSAQSGGATFRGVARVRVPHPQAQRCRAALPLCAPRRAVTVARRAERQRYAHVDCTDKLMGDTGLLWCAARSLPLSPSLSLPPPLPLPLSLSTISIY